VITERSEQSTLGPNNLERNKSAEQQNTARVPERNCGLRGFSWFSPELEWNVRRMLYMDELRGAEWFGCSGSHQGALAQDHRHRPACSSSARPCAASWSTHLPARAQIHLVMVRPTASLPVWYPSLRHCVHGPEDSSPWSKGTLGPLSKRV
jgi:hypothetical protein